MSAQLAFDLAPAADAPLAACGGLRAPRLDPWTTLVGELLTHSEGGRRTFTRTLHAKGIPFIDIAAVLGISGERARQLTLATPHFPG